ncbi:MAG: acyl-CoA-binding protein [Gammaproteobacteria bacterium]|nr:acyl-CoA-binding protein [Gammaproteobacteria bacterium]NNF60442.1 acyl-CoA-binding protein [Gammaproteobacteria bacterium]NNM21788.1 acyl-CoA-binding protein [Gammaproteobacteria bacterium]
MSEDLKEQFEAAAVASKSLSRRPANEDMLELYSLYKQATIGDVSGERPGGFDFVGGAKFDAWSGLKGLTAEEAMRRYVAKIEALKG